MFTIRMLQNCMTVSWIMQIVYVILTVICATNGIKAEVLSIFGEAVKINDVMFVNDVLFETRAPSVLDCGLACLALDNCLFFTYDQSSVMSCRGHWQHMTSDDPHSPAPGSRGYKRQGSRCPVSEGFLHGSEGLCWKILEGSGNWTVARDTCEAQGAALVTLDTAAKNWATENQLPKGDNIYWIDLAKSTLNPTDYNKSSDLQWVRLKKWLTDDVFSYPFPGTSDLISSDLECVAMWNSEMLGYVWVRGMCSFTEGYFACEKP